MSERTGMSGFERYLTVWVGLCILAGIALGQIAPNVALPLVAGFLTWRWIISSRGETWFREKFLLKTRHWFADSPEQAAVEA